MLSVEATGKNIEQAIENALFELKAPREDVEIKILEQGGFFKKAKVLVSISPEEVEKYEKRDKQREELAKKPSFEEEKEEKVSSIIPTKEELEEQPIEKENDVEEEVETITSKVKEDKKEKTLPDAKKAEIFVKGLLNKVSLTADLEIKETEDEVFINILGSSDLIGYRGEGLNALQYLTSVYVGKNNRHAKKIRIDCDNYRARREESLIALANRMAKKVERTHQSVKLEPMTANERRIIHTVLADNEYVETYSKGEEPHRYLIIKPKENN